MTFRVFAITAICIASHSLTVIGQTTSSPQERQSESETIERYLQLLNEETKARTILLQDIAKMKGTATDQNPDPVADALLQYSQFLREESKSHRAFLESLYKISAGFLGGIVVLFGGILAWLNWKTKQDIRQEVDEQFKVHAHAQIEDRLQDFNEYIQGIQHASERQMRNVNRLLLDLTRQASFLEPTGEISDTSPGKPASQDLHGKRILWVDDFPGNNDYPRRILEEQGVKFKLVTSTEKALVNLEDNEFDLVISDMGRGKNPRAGLDLLKSMKELPYEIPVIIFASGRGISSYGQQALDLGAKYTITGFGALLQAVTKLLSGNS